MQRSLRTAITVAGLSLAAFGLARAHAQALPRPSAASKSEVDARWRESLEAFAAADQAHAPQQGGVLFVGSSSIRLWNDLEQQFEPQLGQPPAVVIKRGFGGSRLSDVARYLDRLVLPYAPRLVIVYAGDNDLAEGASPQDVMQSFATLATGVRAALPETRIAYLSIKPSPLRAALMPAIQQANALIEHYAAGQPGMDYIDIYSRMLDEQGQPRAELFLQDRLHLNAQGYALWKQAIAPHLRPPEPAPAREALPPPTAAAQLQTASR